MEKKILLIVFLLFIISSYPVYAFSFQDVTNFFTSLYNSIVSFFNSAGSVLFPKPVSSGGSGGGGGGGSSGPPSCSGSLSLASSGKDTCSITATITANYCDGKSYEIKNGGSKCSGTISGNSSTLNCNWQVTSGTYSYSLYLNNILKSSSSATCSKSPSPACSDGTLYGNCSSTKPKYCKSGTLIDNCTQCGCSSGTCQANETCLVIPVCGNSIINSGEQCELPNTNNNNYCSQSTYSCNYTSREYCTRDGYGNCNNLCRCVADTWSCGSAADTNYCNNCNHCGDGSVNCGEVCEKGQTQSCAGGTQTCLSDCSEWGSCSATAANLVFSIDFDNISSMPSLAGSEWSPINQVDGQPVYFLIWGNSASRTWIEPTQQNTNPLTGVVPRGGTGHCMGGLSGGDGIDGRVEIGFRQDGASHMDFARLGIDKQFYMSEWMYFPPDWHMHYSQNSQYDWYQMLQVTGTINSPWAPHTGIMLYDDTGAPSQNGVKLLFKWEDGAGVNHYKTISNKWMIPLGRWFQVEWFQTWSATGPNRVWCKLDGVVVWDFNDIFVDDGGVTRKLLTVYPGQSTLQIEIGKMYHYDINAHYCYWDDVEIWDDFPTAPNGMPSNVSTSNATKKISMDFTGAYKSGTNDVKGDGCDYVIGTTAPLGALVGGPLEYTNWTIDTNPPVPSPGSGGAALKEWDTNQSQKCRAEFNIYNMETKVGNEIYVSNWYYFPSNWVVPQAAGWYSIADPMEGGSATNWKPMIEIWITQPNPPNFTVTVGGQDLNGIQIKYLNNNGTYCTKTYTPSQFPSGRWFNVKWWLRRDPTLGKSFIKFWFDGQLICNQTAFPYETGPLNYVQQNINPPPLSGTWPPLPQNENLTDLAYGNSYYTTFAKDYHGGSDYVHQLWTDDLEVYNGSPSS